MNMLRPLSPHLKSSLRHLIISFIILSPVMFSAYLFFDLIGLNPDLILLKLKDSLILHGLRAIFRLFGLEIPIFVLLSIVGSVVGSSLHMQDPAGGQPAANPASEGTHRPHLAGAASTPSSSFFRGLSDAAPAPEPGEEVQQVTPTHSISQTDLWNELSRGSPHGNEVSSSAPNEGGQPQGEGPDILRMEQQNPHAEGQPIGPHAPSIEFLKKKIPYVLRGCQRVAVRRNVCTTIFENLHLLDASSQKRLKIMEVLGEIQTHREVYLNNRNLKAAYHLMVSVNDWEREQGNPVDDVP